MDGSGLIYCQCLNRKMLTGGGQASGGMYSGALYLFLILLVLIEKEMFIYMLVEFNKSQKL